MGLRTGCLWLYINNESRWFKTLLDNASLPDYGSVPTRETRLLKPLPVRYTSKSPSLQALHFPFTVPGLYRYNPNIRIFTLPVAPSQCPLRNPSVVPPPPPVEYVRSVLPRIPIVLCWTWYFWYSNWGWLTELVVGIYSYRYRLQTHKFTWSLTRFTK